MKEVDYTFSTVNQHFTRIQLVAIVTTSRWGILELCNTIDTTRYHDTKWQYSTPRFGIVGINFAI